MIESFGLAPPSSRDEALDALSILAGRIDELYAGMPIEEFRAPQGEHWSPEGHLRHLVKSVRAVSSGFSRSRWILLFFGLSLRGSRSYGALLATYHQALADGAQAGRYAPSDRAIDLEPETWRELLLERWREAGRTLAGGATRWSESALDRYRLPHPVLGKLTLLEMLYFTLLHNAHHAARVTERRGGDVGATA